MGLCAGPENSALRQPPRSNSTDPDRGMNGGGASEKLKASSQDDVNRISLRSGRAVSPLNAGASLGEFPRVTGVL